MKAKLFIILAAVICLSGCYRNDTDCTLDELVRKERAKTMQKQKIKAFFGFENTEQNKNNLRN